MADRHIEQQARNAAQKRLAKDPDFNRLSFGKRYARFRTYYEEELAKREIKQRRKTGMRVLAQHDYGVATIEVATVTRKEDASAIGRYWNAVKFVAWTNDPLHPGYTRSRAEKALSRFKHRRVGVERYLLVSDFDEIQSFLFTQRLDWEDIYVREGTMV
jgi:hypothetical protein